LSTGFGCVAASSVEIVCSYKHELDPIRRKHRKVEERHCDEEGLEMENSIQGRRKEGE
jgi:hypothetical protein